MEANIIGSGEIDAEFLETESTYVKINGSGESRVWATENLEVKINGSGELQYKGDPYEIVRKTKGSGSVEKL